MVLNLLSPILPHKVILTFLAAELPSSLKLQRSASSFFNGQDNSGIRITNRQFFIFDYSRICPKNTKALVVVRPIWRGQYMAYARYLRRRGLRFLARNLRNIDVFPQKKANAKENSLRLLLTACCVESGSATYSICSHTSHKRKRCGLCI
jgi:hypothetical protein